MQTNRHYRDDNGCYRKSNRHTASKLALLIIFIAVAAAAGYWAPSLFHSKLTNERDRPGSANTGGNAPAQTSQASPADGINIGANSVALSNKKTSADSNDGQASQSAGAVSAPRSGYWIKIVKKDHKLFVMDGQDPHPTASYSVALGSNEGQKESPGDRRTPEGNFSVQAIQNASGWSHDFKDGKGVIAHAYGPWFIRLKTPWNGIGIHGTHNPDSIGHNVTEGCIRLNNNDLEQLKNSYIKIGSKVVIVDKD